MKLTVRIDYEECLKACLDYAEQQVKLFSELLGKKIDMNEIFGIIRTSANIEIAKSEIFGKYGLQNDDIALLLDMPISALAENLQDRLDYYRTSVKVLSQLVGKSHR